MKIVRTRQELDIARSDLKGQLGFVPTMGALHDGHLSLVKLAKTKADHVIVSIFVNPTQFAPDEDFDAYPRQEEEDAKKLNLAGADIIFLPTQEDLYADGMDSAVNTGDNAQGLEAIFRPTHFQGVVNVVDRLFKAVKPHIAVFGEKDYQQLQVIKEMVEQYDMGIEIIGAPIARDNHGLALSSRNAYLNAKEINIARELNVTLKDLIATLPKDENKRMKCTLIAMAKGRLLDAGFDKIDYIDIRWNRVLAAAWLGKTRLIDNMATQ